MRGIAHDLAHHAVSGLSFLHPHIRESHPQGDRVTINLLERSGKGRSPALMATDAFRSRFAGLLEAAGVEPALLVSASATFFYRADPGPSDWPFGCYVQLVLINGEPIEDAVGADGRRAEILRR